ncbi:MAG: prepilin peptidase [bacterium]|nr:prepilin peptidase [bacterium]
MDLIFYAGVFLFGLSVGSFLNALVFRLGTAESVLWGRSHCMTCKHTLEWYELIPVMSFVVLGGKCRTCHDPISSQYPIVEILTAAVFLFLYASYKSTIFFTSPFFIFGNMDDLLWYVFGLLFYFLSAALLIGIGIYDFRTKIIAPSLMFLFFSLTLLWQVTRWYSGVPIAEIITTALGALGVFAFFAGLWFFSRGRAMGFGDAQLSSAIVLFLGATQGLLAVLFSFWLGALFGIFMIILGKARLKSEIPFGPFLVAGAFLAMFWGDAMLWAYFAVFL